MNGAPTILALLEEAFDRGNSRRFAELESEVRRWIARRVPAKDLDDRVQDALEKLMGFWRKEGPDRLRDLSDASARAYTRRVAENAVISAWRKSHRLEQAEQDAYTEARTRSDDHTPATEGMTGNIPALIIDLNREIVARYPALGEVLEHVSRLAYERGLRNEDLLGDAPGDRSARRLTLQQHHCRWRKLMGRLADHWRASGRLDEDAHRHIQAFVAGTRQRKPKRPPRASPVSATTTAPRPPDAQGHG